MSMWLKRLFLTIFFIIFVTDAKADFPPTQIYDEGIKKGVFFNLDCAGAGINCTQSGITGTITVGGGAPTDADYLVGTANGTLSAEIVVGTAPGGELGNTWASPTIDTTHSGSAHHTSFLSTDIDTSAEIATIVGDETGTGVLVFGTSPTFTTDITFPALSIEAGAYGAATIDGDDINSNLAGRSLTLTAASPDTLDADAELYTIRFNSGLENPVAADDDILQCEPAGAFTITEIACSTDTGTATINFNENVNTTPNTAGTAILSADIVCDTNRQSSCASGCDVNTISNGTIAAGNLISMVVTSVASTPTKLRIHIKGTYDD